MKNRIFIVNDDTWKEHNKVGIAGINDAVITHPDNQNRFAARQSAIAEISGIRPGDILFFNRMGSERHPPELLGIYEATTKAYYDPNPLTKDFPNVVKKIYRKSKSYSKIDFNKTHPFRVAFKCVHNFLNPINMEEIWALRDKGKIWTLQQSRGDAVGVHACVGITKMEAKLVERLLRVNNIVVGSKIVHQTTQKNKKCLPINFRTDKEGMLHYEAVLKAMLLKDFANGKHKKIFGDYDDFIPYVPTGARKEMDILLLKYNGDDILWYQILELKQNKFTMDELQKLIIYEKEIIRSQAENPLQVYPIAVASQFNEEVIKFVKGREDYKERPIRLIKYYFDQKNKPVKLEELK